MAGQNTQILAYVAFGARLIMFDDDDEEDEVNRILEKVNDFAEITVPRYRTKQFQQHFRMTPETFECFLQKLHCVVSHEVKKGHPELPIEKQAMILIWCLGNIESFRCVADRFGISKASCWGVLYRNCERMLQINQRYKLLCWPSAQRMVEIQNGFSRINNFPGTMGAIDGSHIPIQKPNIYGNSYINRKNYASVLLQGVCDHQKLFIDVYAGEPGSMHDARLFRKSNLYHRISTGEVDFPRDSHLVGDLAYKLAPYLMVAFKNIGHLTEQQKNYNFQLSQQRVVIENAFALLKGRFRRLKMLDTIRLDYIALLIVTACILHNVCVLAGDILDKDLNAELDAERRNQIELMNNEPVNDAEEAAYAIRKRVNIVNQL